jgi:hypothetical protein
MNQLEAVLDAVRESAKAAASLQNAADRIAFAVDALRTSATRAGGSAVININAGGWATIVACAVAVGCMLLQVRGAFAQAEIDSTQSADVRELRDENRRLNDYLSALYRQYPELRPEHLKKGTP